jgi:hypothetical protein
LSLDSPQRLTYIDPNAPKRGLSAYMFFANEQRETVREENPGISFGRQTARSRTVAAANNYVQAKSARSSVTSGRLSARSSASHTRRRPQLTRSVMKMRRPSTMWVHSMLHL